MNPAPRLLFVCAGNTGRSVSAETMARLHLASCGLEAEVASRGLAVDPDHSQAEGPAQILWARRGIDLSRHIAQSLEAKDVEAADVILCATRAHRDLVAAQYLTARSKAFTLAEYSGVGGELHDAFGKPMSAYESMLTQLECQIPPTIERIFAERQSKPR